MSGLRIYGAYSHRFQYDVEDGLYMMGGVGGGGGGWYMVGGGGMICGGVRSTLRST